MLITLDTKEVNGIKEHLEFLRYIIIQYQAAHSYLIEDGIVTKEMANTIFPYSIGDMPFHQDVFQTFGIPILEKYYI